MKLEVSGLYYGVKGKEILSGVYLSIEVNEIVGLFGRNGSGKSTFMDVVFGLKKADFIDLRLNGNKINVNNYPRPFIGYLPQDGYLPPSVSLKSVFEWFEIDDKNILRILDVLDQPSSTRVKSLSLGQKKIFELLILLYSKITFLLLDEPFSGLSPLNIEKVVLAIAENNLRKGILITDHQYQTVLDISNRACVIENGSIKLLAQKDDVLNTSYLIHP
jgi:ABC-type multidrug transport system ATPase subunit